MGWASVIVRRFLCPRIGYIAVLYAPAFPHPPLWMMRKGGGFCERFDDQVGSHRFFLLFGDPRSLMGNAQAAAPFSLAEMPESLLNSPARNNRAPARESQVQSRHLLRRS